MQRHEGPEPGSRGVLVASFVLVLGLLAGRTQVHVCDGDAQLYRVVARNIVERGSWLDLTYLPGVHPAFREHLPFGLWPTAAAIRFLGEASLRWLDGLWVVATLALVAWLARRLWSGWAAAGAVLALGVMDPVMVFGTFPRLDGSSTFLSLVAAAPWLLGVPRWRGLLLSVTAAALATMVKGPFGLVVLVVASTARAFVSRSFLALVLGGVATFVAAAPVAAFLFWQRSHGDASWWTGYVDQQLLSSARGHRHDGTFDWWFPFRALWRHFWPALGVVPFALWRSWKERGQASASTRNVPGLAFGLGVLALCLPKRKIAHHLMPLYPLGVLFVADTLGSGLAFVFGRARHALWARRAFLGLGVVAWVLVVSGHPPWARSVKCLPRSELAEEISAIAPGSHVWVISPTQQWRNVAALAAERRLLSWPVSDWGAAQSLPQPASFALVEDTTQGSAPEGWSLAGRGSGWSLWTRTP